MEGANVSEILSLYEEEKMKVDESLVEQYLHNQRIVKEFTAYYDLFNKYKKEYQTEEIPQRKHVFSIFAMRPIQSGFYFYKIETTVNGRSYVTARGWEDLSEILSLYEEEQMTPTRS